MANSIKTLVRIAALTAVAGIAYLSSGWRPAPPASPARFTDQFLSLIESESHDLKVVKHSELKLAISPADGEYDYVVSLQPLHQFLSKFPRNRNGRRKIMQERAEGFLSTIRYFKEHPPVDMSAESIPVADVLRQIRESWPDEVVLAYHGESRSWSDKPGPESKNIPEGRATYHTTAEISQRGRLESRFEPLVQLANSPGDQHSPRFVTSAFDGTDWFWAEGNRKGELPLAGGTAEVGPERKLSDFYHENGLAGFPAYFPVTLSHSLRDLLDTPELIEKFNLNLWAAKLSDGTVRLTIMGGIIEDGIVRGEMIFDPARRWAFLSGKTMVNFDEAGETGLKFAVNCEEFQDLGSQAGFVPGRVRFEWHGDFVIEQQLSEFEVREDVQADDFRPELGPDWTVTQTSL